MKIKFLLAFILSNLLFTGFAQIELSATELAQIKNEIDIEADSVRILLTENQQDGYFHPELSIEFGIDTFKIERLYERKMELSNYTTFGMVHSTYDATADYDKLLNKYYKLLLSKLSESDKEILRAAQRNWIAFRDSEIKLIETMSKDEYSGGGTMQQLIVSGRIHALTKERVIKLVDLLLLCE